MKMMTNLKKVYERPLVEIVPMGGDGLMENVFSGVNHGDGVVEGFGVDNSSDMAREYDWDDSWNDFDMPNNNGKNYW